MKLRAWVFTGFGFCLLLAGIALLRTVSDISAAVQAWLFVILGATCFVIGLIFCVRLRDEDGDDWAEVPPGALWPIGLLGLGACLAGLYWSASASGTWSTYAALPLISYEEVSRQAPGTLVRVEGMAHSERALRGGDGSALALQRVEFSHTYGVKSRHTVIDYSAIAPTLLVLQKQTDGAAGPTLAVKTGDFDKSFSVLSKAYLSLDGPSREVEQRIEKLISPVFKNYKYSSTGSSQLEVWSLPQDTPVTVCGATPKEPGPERPVIEARSIAMLTGEAFLAMAHQGAGESRKVGVVWWSIGGLILLMIGLIVWRSRYP